ncbi:MAG: hypothetical protein ACN6O2_12990 [Stenotrophomonas sp.]
MKAEQFTQSTTVKLLDQWKAKTSTESDYKAAKTLGITQSTISGWRHGRSHAKPALAARMAKDLGLDEMAVLAAIEADRAHDGDDRRTWQKHGRAAFLALAMGISLSASVQASAPLTLRVEYAQMHPLCEIDDGPTALGVALDHFLLAVHRKKTQGTSSRNAEQPTQMFSNSYVQT